MDQGIFQNVFNRKVEPIKRSIIEARLGLSPSLVVVDELKMTPIFPQFSVKLIIIQESFEKSVLHTETASAFPSWILSWMDVGHSVQTISRMQNFFRRKPVKAKFWNFFDRRSINFGPN